MKIWIDTDIGGDVDDAFAILLAMADKNVELIGVSTVFGDTVKRAQVAKTILSMAGAKTIPVYAGEKMPIKTKKVFYDIVDDNVGLRTYITDLFEDTKIDGTDAVEKMRDAILSSSEKITLVTLGALTNVAKLFTDYPETVEKLDRVFIMGGAEYYNISEFNIVSDPEAADIVLNSKAKLYLTTLDVTLRCELTKEDKISLEKCESEVVKTVLKMDCKWQKKTLLHDPLTLACAIRDDFVNFGLGNVKVELEGGMSRGKFINLCDYNWKIKPRDNLFLSRSIDSEKFIKYYIDSIIELDKLIVESQNKF